MKSLSPHLTFPGTARDALHFYQSVFGGEASFIPVGDRQGTGLGPDAIFHSELKGHSFSIMAADGATVGIGHPSIHIECEEEFELERYFSALSDGGSVHCDICTAFGGLYAEATDRFGIRWFLTLSGKSDRT